MKFFQNFAQNPFAAMRSSIVTVDIITSSSVFFLFVLNIYLAYTSVDLLSIATGAPSTLYVGQMGMGVLSNIILGVFIVYSIDNDSTNASGSLARKYLGKFITPNELLSILFLGGTSIFIFTAIYKDIQDLSFQASLAEELKAQGVTLESFPKWKENIERQFILGILADFAIAVVTKGFKTILATVEKPKVEEEVEEEESTNPTTAGN